MDIRPEIYRMASEYTKAAEKSMIILAGKTAKLGAETADQSARKVVKEDERNWERIRTAGLISGPLFNASKDALRKIPSAITEKVTNLVMQAVSMAETGLDWLMGQIENALGGIWSGLQRIVRTLAEQMFRKAQQEQAQKIPVNGWRRIANHETACLACLLLEGRIYDREEDFADHPNGRCTIVPCEGSEARNERTGKKWLEEQDEETQKRIMGKSRFEYWKAGELSLDDMTDTINDPVFGKIPHIRPLREFGLTPVK